MTDQPNPVRDAFTEAAIRRSALLTGADAIENLPQDYECDPGRGDAVNVLRRLADFTTSEEQPTGPTWEARAEHAVRLYARTAIERDDALAEVAKLRADRPTEPTHQGPHPEHGGLETHRGTRDQCTGPDCGPVDTRRYWIAVDVPADDLDDDLPDALAYAADRAETVLQEERGYGSTAWHATETHDAERADLIAQRDRIANDTTQALAEQPFVPRTEREYWQAIADALNAANRAGMPVGIDLDGTLTDHRMWSVVWDRAAKRWDVAGYEDDDQAPAAPEQPTALTYSAGLIEAARLAEQGRVADPMGEAEEHVNDCFTTFAADLRRKAAEAQQ
ncbi:hypothetical protein ACH4GE_18955 [Streptomyces tendae]|uniref:hypothetical protein n=1 Tax=Streptomyces TaxID=1883 RepID=UPI0037910217